MRTLLQYCIISCITIVGCQNRQVPDPLIASFDWNQWASSIASADSAGLTVRGALFSTHADGGAAGVVAQQRYIEGKRYLTILVSRGSSQLAEISLYGEKGLILVQVRNVVAIKLSVEHDADKQLLIENVKLLSKQFRSMEEKSDRTILELAPGQFTIRITERPEQKEQTIGQKHD